MSKSRDLAALLDSSGDVVADALDNAGGGGGVGEFKGDSIAISSDDTALANDDGTNNRNIALGDLAGNSITSGADNILLGDSAGKSITSQSYSVVIGAGAAIGGDYSRDVFIGNATGGAAANYPSWGGNVGIGFEAMKWSKNDYSNVGIGRESLLSCQGGYNIGIGHKAGENVTTGANNIIMGSGGGTSTAPSGAISTASNIICLGNNSVTSAYIKVSWTVTSDERDKADITPLTHGLDVVESITPINYFWDNRSDYWVTTPEVRDETGEVTQEAITTKHDSDGSLKQGDDLRIGLSAQNVKAALDNVGYTGNAVVNSNDPENLKITETNLIPFLVNAIKELSEKIKVLEEAQ
jgi:hypothetical protein